MEQAALRESNNKKRKIRLTTEFYLMVFFLVVLVFLWFMAPGFYTTNNIMTVLNFFSYLLIGAIGMNLIIITANIDVSAGAIISVISIVIAFAGKAGLPLYAFLPLAIVTGAILSLLNGLFITKLRIPAIVATLATTQLFAGALPLVVEGSIYDLPASFTWLAFEAKIFGIVPASLLFAVVITAIALVFMKYSRFSKKIYAVGNNVHAAMLSGINVDRVIAVCFILAGALYGVTATIIATAGQRVTTTMASGLEMTIIAAVVLGGTSIMGGSGKIIGTVLGSLILAIISPAMNYMGLSSDWSDTVMGAIILIAVIFGSISMLSKKQRVQQGDGNKNASSDPAAAPPDAESSAAGGRNGVEGR